MTESGRAVFVVASLACAMACGEDAPIARDGSGAGTEAAPAPAAAPQDTASRASIIDRSGGVIGEAVARPMKGGILLDVRAAGLPPGPHGLHLHAVGDCSDHDEFLRSGSHVSRENEAHGLFHPDGPHAGDFPNLHVPADGTLRAEFVTVWLTMADLHDADGAALVIHADVDDYRSQPIGGSGARIACAAFRGGP